MNIRDVAISLAQRGFCVFRLKERGKTPIGKWKDQATNSLDEIEDWKAKGYNIGLACGPRSGVWVLDVDDEDANIAILEKISLPATYTIKTGKGYHYYFKWVQGMPITNSHRCEIDKIDVRGDGGYVVAEGSTHETGHVYTCIDQSEPAEADKELMELLWPPKKPQPAPRSAAPSAAPTGNQDRFQAYTNKTINEVLDDLRATTKGGRNNALNKAAFRLGQFVGAEWSPLDHAAAEAELWAAARATGLPDREIAQCLKHAIDDGAREPEQMPVDRPRPTKIVHSSPMPEAVPHDEIFDEVFTRGDDVEVKNKVLTVLAQRGPMVYDRGALWQYRTTHWEHLFDSKVGGVVERFAGCSVEAGKDKETGEKKYKQLKLSTSSVKGVISLLKMDETVEHIGYFAETDKGFPFANGFMRMTKDRKDLVFEPHAKEQRVRWVSSINYNPDAQAPMFEQFLTEILPGTDEQDGDNLRTCVLQFFGACLMGDAPHWQKALLIYGSGANGKSVLLKILEAAAGKSRCVNVSPQDMAENEYSRARLDGALINIVPDMPLREVMESGAFKQAVAGDTMSAREPYKPEFSFTPIAGHVMSVNHLPKVADDSWGFRRRFLTVPFTVTIPEERQDQGLAGRIIDQELEGVVNLCIDAFRLLLEERKYTTANSERQLLTEWIYDGDIVSQWVTALDDKECRLTSFEGKDETFDNWVAASRLYAAYADWCKTNNFKPFGSNKWATKLATFSRCTYKKTRDGRFWKIAALPL